VSAVGRRPGNADTRGEIVEAAKRVFASKGYDGTSLRGVAREAGVDPALVHHYFDGKASLFVAAMALPFDPRQVKEHAAGTEHSGARTIEGFLTMWDRAEGTGSSFASCLSAMAASSNVADAMREFINDRVWSVLRRNEGETEALRRRWPSPATSSAYRPCPRRRPSRSDAGSARRSTATRKSRSSPNGGGPACEASWSPSQPAGALIKSRGHESYG
jgi:AcrR family transcriptional regulator